MGFLEGMEAEPLDVLTIQKGMFSHEYNPGQRESRETRHR